MITFEQARQLVVDHVRPQWSPSLGELITLPDGFEDATHWRVIAGAREALVDQNRDFDAMDMPALLVGKYSAGMVVELAVIANLDRLDRMTPTR